MRVTREKASFGALAVLLAGALLPAAAQAQGLHNGGCTDPTPCGVVPHPRFVNVYWGSFADVYNPNTTSAPTTSDRIDAFVGALVNSRYFDDAAQYGVHPAQMLPSIFVTPGVCPGVNIPQTVGDDESDGLEAHGLADALVGCLLAHYPFLDNDRTVFNLILAPGVQPIDGWCTSKGAGADHWRYRGIPTTFIPTNSQCSASSWNSLGQILTHEMIESVTDANPWWGWTENWAGPYIGEEAGDLCNGGTPSIPQGPATFPFMGALLGSDVGAYWNEAVHGCSAGFGSGAPALSEHHVVGTGKNMRFHLEGQFEGPPWDLTTNNHSSEGGMGTLYLSAVVTGGHNWKAGNFWRPGKEDLVGFSQISWTSSGGTDVIDITGFDGFYQPKGGFGQRAIRVGDHIAVTVTNPRTGQSVNATFDAPVASAFGTLTVVPPANSPNHWTFFNDASEIHGTFVDALGGLIESAEAFLHTSAGNFSSGLTGPDGAFVVPLQTASAGQQPVYVSATGINGSITAQVHPVATSLNPPQGDAAGGVVMTLSGAGFLGGHTTVEFNCGFAQVAPATNVQVSANGATVQFTTPPSPCGAATAQVYALVDGLPGLPLSYQYIVPDQPVLTYLPGCPVVGNLVFNALEVDAFKGDGSLSTEKIDLTAPYNAFNFGTASSLEIDSNHHVGLNGTGPITATPEDKPWLAITGSFENVPNPDCHPGLRGFASIFQFMPGGPVESINVRPTVAIGEGRDTQLVTWALPAVEGQFGVAMVQLQGQLAGAMSALVTVRALGREQLARAFSTHSTLVSQQRGQARLAGTPFQVEAALGRDAPILIGVFKLDAGVTGQVVWAADAPGSPWIPVASKLSRDHAGRTATDMTRGPGMITFGIQASGIYALATRPVVRAGRETEDQDRRAGEREDDR